MLQKAITEDGVIELRLDKEDAPVIGVLEARPTGGMDTWKTQSASVDGIHDLYFKFVGGKGQSMNFDWWKFE